MRESGILKISYMKLGYSMEFFVAAPLSAIGDEYTALFNILRQYENRRNIDTELTEEQLRSKVTALGITDVTWEFI
jgi:hypothetical protein